MDIIEHLKQKINMRANYQNSKPGDKVKLIHSGKFWNFFTDRTKNGEELSKEPEQILTIKKISVASSSTGVRFEEKGEKQYELGWFEKVE